MMHVLSYLRVGIALADDRSPDRVRDQHCHRFGMVAHCIDFAWSWQARSRLHSSSPPVHLQATLGTRRRAYSDIRSEGHSTVGSGLAGGRASIEPGSTSWNTREVLNAAVPLLAAAALLGLWFAL